MQKVNIGGTEFKEIEVRTDKARPFSILLITDSQGQANLDMTFINTESFTDLPTESDEALYLNNLNVEEPLRQMGVGSYLVDRAKQFADEVGRDIVLDVQASFGVSQESYEQFFERRGFERIKYSAFIYRAKI